VSSAPSATRRWVYITSVVLIWVVFDQTTKAWAYHHLADGHPIDIFWTLRLRLTFNTGSAFSVGAGAGPFMGLGSLFVSGVLVYFARRLDGWLNLTAVALVLGGAIGNLLDRIWRESDGFLQGAVVDFIDLQWWPVFNVADIGIVVGAVFLALSMWQRQSGPVDVSTSA